MFKFLEVEIALMLIPPGKADQFRATLFLNVAN